MHIHILTGDTFLSPWDAPRFRERWLDTPRWTPRHSQRFTSLVMTPSPRAPRFVASLWPPVGPRLRGAARRRAKGPPPGAVSRVRRLVSSRKVWFPSEPLPGSFCFSLRNWRGLFGTGWEVRSWDSFQTRSKHRGSSVWGSLVQGRGEQRSILAIDFHPCHLCLRSIQCLSRAIGSSQKTSIHRWCSMPGSTSYHYISYTSRYHRYHKFMIDL